MTESVFTSASASTYTLEQSRLLIDPVNRRTFFEGVINSFPELIEAFSQFVFISVYIKDSTMEELNRYCRAIILQYIVTVCIPYVVFVHGVRDAVNKHVQGIYNAAIVYALYSFIFSMLLSFLAGLILFFFNRDSLFGKLYSILGFASELLVKEMILFGEYTGYRDRALCIAALEGVIFATIISLLQIIGRVNEVSTIIAFLVPSLGAGFIGLYFSLPTEDQSLSLDFREMLPLRPKLLLYLIVTSYGSLAQEISQILALSFSLCLVQHCKSCEEAEIALYYYLIVWQFATALKTSFNHFSFMFYNINFAAKRVDRLGFFERSVFGPFCGLNTAYAAVWFLITLFVSRLFGGSDITAFYHKYAEITRLAALSAFLPGVMLDFNALGVYKITQSVASALAALSATCMFLLEFYAKLQENPLSTLFCYQLVYDGVGTLFIAVTYASVYYVRRAANLSGGADVAGSGETTEAGPYRASQASEQNQTSQQSEINNSWQQNTHLSGIPALRTSCSQANESQPSEVREADRQTSRSDVPI